MTSSGRAIGAFLVFVLISSVACAPASPQAPASPDLKPSAAASTTASGSASAKSAAATTAPAVKPAEATTAPAAKPAAATTAVEDFYRGKTIKIVVAYAPGGGYDTISRLVAQHLGKYIPGNPTVIVENRPGAGGMLALNQIYNTERRDGTVIASFAENQPLLQATGAEGVQFDANKLNFLMSSLKATGTCVARTDSGVNNLQDLMSGKQLIVGTNAPGSAGNDIPAVLNGALGTNFKLVPGYDGFAKILLALESREVDGFCASFDTLVVTAKNQLEGSNPTAKTIVVLSDNPPDHPFVKGVPSALSFAKTDEAKQLIRAIDAPAQMTKPFAFGPEVPQERVNAMRRAFEATYADPEFLAQADQAKIPLNPASGEETEKIVEGVFATPAPVLAKLKELLK